MSRFLGFVQRARTFGRPVPTYLPGSARVASSTQIMRAVPMPGRSILLDCPRSARAQRLRADASEVARRALSRLRALWRPAPAPEVDVSLPVEAPEYVGAHRPAPGRVPARTLLRRMKLSVSNLAVRLDDMATTWDGLTAVGAVIRHGRRTRVQRVFALSTLFRL